MIALFPAGFEEREVADELELAAYGGGAAAERLADVVGPVTAVAAEAGWEERWKEFHRPVRIGHLWVGPPWERPEADAVAVVIDPGRAFGTGAHPTTRLSLELLLTLEPAALADLGCGSGVLAVAAAKFGFDPVIAVDVEEVAVEATRENAAANGVVVEARRADILADPLPPTDIAVANVELTIVEALARRLTARRLVASGYLAHEHAEIPGWHVLDRREAEGWAADLLEPLYD